MLKAKVKKKDIWCSLKIPESTLYRELKRNSKKITYNAEYAQMLATERKRDKHKKIDLILLYLVFANTIFIVF